MTRMANSQVQTEAIAWGRTLLAEAVERSPCPPGPDLTRQEVAANAAMYAISCITLAIPTEDGSVATAAQALGAVLGDLLSSFAGPDRVVLLGVFQQALNRRVAAYAEAMTPRGSA